MIAFFIVSPFVVALPAAWLATRFPGAARFLAAWPAILTVVLSAELRSTLDAGARLIELPWAPSLGLSLSFNLDGLGLLFALLITAIGTLVVLYASLYMEGHPQAARFYASLFAFMGAMLGVVVSGNLVQLVVFWELTSVFSFLLIGYWTHRKDARRGARMAFTVTATGGLALLAGVLILGHIVGSSRRRCLFRR